jgi:DNA-directed RNA polymerase omega subunit
MSDPRLASTAQAGDVEGPVANVLLNRFYVVSLALQRARQLASGARPRLEPDGHKHVRVALLEVVAGLVSGLVSEKSPGA